MRVLIVDDDAMYRALVVEALRYEGTELGEANSPASALRLLNSDSEFDVILCDLQMNGLDGLELLKTLRIQYPQIPVVVTSAYSSEGGIGELALRHAAYYLAKPFSIKKLLDVIQNVAHLRYDRA
jgi:two-component system response regulator FlrC